MMAIRVGNGSMTPPILYDLERGSRVFQAVSLSVHCFIDSLQGSIQNHANRTSSPANLFQQSG